VNPASATPDSLPPLGLTWGIKRSFIDYIAGLPDGAVSAADGATVIEPGRFCFAPEGSDYNIARGTGVLRFRGDVRVAGHHGMMFVRLLDPWIELSGGRGTLSISTGDGSGQERTEVGTLRAAAAREIDGYLVWEHVDVLISPAGSELFDGQYAAGQPMDPLSIRVAA
jgi:hypothetical protein